MTTVPCLDAETTGAIGDWHDVARCAGHYGLFFGSDESRAKAFCALCPVWADCLETGMAEEHGIWGGLNRAERARVRRLRSRLVQDPGDGRNERDIRHLASRGLTVERLIAVLPVLPERLRSLADAAQSAPIPSPDPTTSGSASGE